VGSYNVTISKEGFRAARFKAVPLEAGERRTLEVELTVGAVAEAVEISATIEDDEPDFGRGRRLDRSRSEGANGEWPQLV
jgi:hypothetical protein